MMDKVGFFCKAMTEPLSYFEQPGTQNEARDVSRTTMKKNPGPHIYDEIVLDTSFDFKEI